eukprot:240513-Rhodomonas_salina.2
MLHLSTRSSVCAHRRLGTRGTRQDGEKRGKGSEQKKVIGEAMSSKDLVLEEGVRCERESHTVAFRISAGRWNDSEMASFG